MGTLNYSMDCLKFMYDISMLPDLSFINSVLMHLQFQGNVSIFSGFVDVPVKWLWSCSAGFIALDSFQLILNIRGLPLGASVPLSTNTAKFKFQVL